MTKTVIFITIAFVAGILLSQFFLAIPGVSGASGTEQMSPGNHVSEDQIKVYQDHVTLNVEGVEWASFADTNSMDPLFDTEAHALQIIPESADEVNVGDIISYTTKSSDSRIIHRVVFKGTDTNGIYFITKGDNNQVSDAGKVRFDQVERVLFAIIY